MTSSDNSSWDDAQRHLARVDPVLRRVISAIGPCTIGRKPNSFAALAEAIVHQQLSLAAGRTIYHRVKALAGGRSLTADSLNEISDQQLRDAGLSRSKVLYLRDLAAHISDRRLRLRALPHREDDEIVSALTSVKGIGPWSAEMYLIFVLNRPDVFSPGDVGLQRAVRELYAAEHNTPRMRNVIESWRPYRSVACWYLWASLGESIEW